MLGATGSPMMSVRNTWDEGSEGKLCRDPWEDAVPRGELAKLAQCCRVQGAHTGRSLLVTLRPVDCEPWTPGTLGALPPWFWGTPLSFPMPLISASPFPPPCKQVCNGRGWMGKAWAMGTTQGRRGFRKQGCAQPHTNLLLQGGNTSCYTQSRWFLCHREGHSIVT